MAAKQEAFLSIYYHRDIIKLLQYILLSLRLGLQPFIPELNKEAPTTKSKFILRENKQSDFNKSDRQCADIDVCTVA